MTVFTKWGKAEIGALTGCCYFQGKWPSPDGEECTDGRYWVTNLNEGTGKYEDRFYWMQKGGKIVGVCQKHAEKLEAEGWENLGMGGYHPVEFKET